MSDCVWIKTTAAGVCIVLTLSACPAQEIPNGAGSSGLEAIERIAGLEPLQAEDSDNLMRQLLIARSNIALEGLKNRLIDLRQGHASFHTVFDNYRRYFETQLDLCESDEEKAARIKEVMVVLQDLEARQVAMMASRKLKRTPPSLTRFRFAIASARVNLLRLEQGFPVEAIRFNP